MKKSQMDITGQRFGRLIAVKNIGRMKENSNAVYWRCICQCGNVVDVSIYGLLDGNTASCGCLARDVKSAVHTTHGGTVGGHSRLFNIHTNMKQRCTNPNNPRYMDYGGRGITLCEEWMDFEMFRAWALSHGYSENLTIERIDNDRGYCPDNCKWIPRGDQSGNRRFNHRLTIDGETHTVAEWSRLSGTNVSTIHTRLNRGWSDGEAVYGRGHARFSNQSYIHPPMLFPTPIWR